MCIGVIWVVINEVVLISNISLDLYFWISIMWGLLDDVGLIWDSDSLYLAHIFPFLPSGNMNSFPFSLNLKEPGKNSDWSQSDQTPTDVSRDGVATN